jgi:sterol desaturase/sphingolipid hydroxylase (fatty acid hydroxylase superfamily)
MPTPIDILLDPISLAVQAIYASLIALEAVFPARALPAVRGWRLRGIAAFYGFLLLSTYLPLLWSEYLAAFQLVDLSGLGRWTAAAIGLVVYELGVYVWHRSMHSSGTLWRTFHQMHHSAERLDTAGAFWFSPLDMFGWTALSSLCLTVIVGLPAEAATLVVYATTFLSVFQHTNVRTPRWLGYIVQRPESHSRHHERGVHADNYSDLPVFDLIFGTFRNPRDFAPAQGFYEGASWRVPAMLAFRDVSTAPPADDGAPRPASRRADVSARGPAVS